MSTDSSAFSDHVLELMASQTGIMVKRMFGGQGTFREGLMFAIIADGTLYLKTDEETVNEFEERGLEAFVVLRKDRVMVTSYRLCPEEALERSAEMNRWASIAWQAAVREDELKPVSRRKRQVG